MWRGDGEFVKLYAGHSGGVRSVLGTLLRYANLYRGAGVLTALVSRIFDRYKCGCCAVTMIGAVCVVVSCPLPQCLAHSCGRAAMTTRSGCGTRRLASVCVCWKATRALCCPLFPVPLMWTLPFHTDSLARWVCTVLVAAALLVFLSHPLSNDFAALSLCSFVPSLPLPVCLTLCSPQRPCVWSGSDDGIIRAWDVGARVCVRVCVTGARVNELAPMGGHVWSCGRDSLLSVWDTKTMSLARKLAGHTSYVAPLLHFVIVLCLAGGGVSGGGHAWSSSSCCVFEAAPSPACVLLAAT